MHNFLSIILINYLGDFQFRQQVTKLLSVLLYSCLPSPKYTLNAIVLTPLLPNSLTPKYILKPVGGINLAHI